MDVGIDAVAQQQLLSGQILTQTFAHSLWGGAVTAQIYLPIERSQVWTQLTNYPRWVQYFPDMVRSDVIGGDRLSQGSSQSSCKRLHQVARKAFFLLTAQVEIYLQVIETVHRSMGNSIQFCLEKGDFNDFSACLHLQDLQIGTLLTYSVQATPTIPVPSMLIQEAMRLDLPSNLKKMRQVLCDR